MFQQMLKSPHINIVLIVLALLKICSMFSQKVSRFDPGILYIQLTTTFVWFFMVNSTVIHSRIFSTTNYLLSTILQDNSLFVYIATPPSLRIPLVR